MTIRLVLGVGVLGFLGSGFVVSACTSGSDNTQNLDASGGAGEGGGDSTDGGSDATGAMPSETGGAGGAGETELTCEPACEPEEAGDFAECIDGTCVYTELVTEVTFDTGVFPAGVGLDEENLYFSMFYTASNTNLVNVVPKTGGEYEGMEAVVIQGADTWLVVTDDSVIVPNGPVDDPFADFGNRIDKETGDVTPAFPIPWAGHAYTAAVLTGDTVTMADVPTDAGPSSIWELAADGSGSPFNYHVGTWPTTGLARNAAGVLYAEYAAEPPPAPYAIKDVPVLVKFVAVGTATEVVLTAPVVLNWAEGAAIQLTDEFAYIQTDTFELHRAGLTGTPAAEPLYTADGRMVSFGSVLYFSDPTEGALFALDDADTERRMISSYIREPLVTDGEYVYGFATAGGGSIYRVKIAP
jgi:hypothetical protein